jgi:hypothetical protein
MTDTTRISDLDRLADFARTHADAIEADNQAKLAARRENACQAAADHAARDYAVCFAALGNIPPNLEWTGYPKGRDTDRLHIHATAYLGQGLFLAHRPYPHQRANHGRHRINVGSFTIVGADFPDADYHNGPHGRAVYVADLLALAEILHLIHTRRENCPQEATTR